jgi:hypothetical protein
MERDSGSVTAVFYRCRSAVRPNCAPADAWSSSVAGVWSALGETPAHRAMEVLDIDADQRVVFERCAPRVNEAVERLRGAARRRR